MGDARMTSINQRAIDAVVEPIVAKIAGEVLSEAVANVPQDTGTLGRSLTAAPVGQGRWVVGTNVVYAPFVEFGTRHSPVPPGRVRHGGMRPFLGTALETVRRRWRLR